MPSPSVHALITMAGNGERFRRAGYLLPKFKIVVRGRTLFSWAVGSLTGLLDAGSQVIFAVRPEHDPAGFVRREAGLLGITNFDLAIINGPTDGQATTALLAGRLLRRPQDPVLVYNIDTYVDPHALRRPAASAAGWIPCFLGRGEAWSFARSGPDGLVCEVAEKRRISDFASVGLYWFRSFGLFQHCYALAYAGARPGPSERYVAPLYNRLCGQQGGVYMSVLPDSAVHPLGTPEELEAFRG